MSRSYKKFPVRKQQADKDMKRFANKAVRRTEDIPNGGSYKKCFESWEISDWGYIWTKQDAINNWYKAQSESRSYNWIKEHFTTLEQYLAYWEKCTRRK